MQRAGLPAGVLNLVMGPGATVGAALGVGAGHRRHQLHRIARRRAAASRRRRVENGARVQLEMGGKNPLIVLDDADMATAVSVAVNGAYFQTGQRCTASSRIIVTEGIHDRFVAAMVERMKKLVVDDALKPGTEIGPVVDERQLDKNLEYIEIGKKEGAQLAYGGERLKRETDGYYMAPAIFTETAPEMRINQEEIFGPVAAVIRVQELRGGARGGERDAVRPVVWHRDDVAEAREPFQAQRAERAGDGQSADGGPRLSRAVRRPEEVELRPARAGGVREGVLHDREDGVYRPVRSALRRQATRGRSAADDADAAARQVSRGARSCLARAAGRPTALERGKVFVNDVEVALADAARRLAAGDVVRVWMDRPGSAKPPAPRGDDRRPADLSTKTRR